MGKGFTKALICRARDRRIGTGFHGQGEKVHLIITDRAAKQRIALRPQAMDLDEALLLAGAV